MILEKYLNKKPMYYDQIDYSNIQIAWKDLKKKINLPYVIHIVGTNGKGSTGRFLASLLFQNKYTVLHYSSPHILKFNERIWVNGQDSCDEHLNEAHKKLQKIISNELLLKLTYFEYTTLIAIYLSSNLNYLILEAGLGGEFDATNVVKNDLSVFTCIGIDHTEFLGNSIEEICETKMRSCDKAFILGKQIFTNEVDKIKNKVLSKKKEIYFEDTIIPEKSLKLPTYLQDNLKLSMNVLRYLNIEQKYEFLLPKIFGRCEQLTPNITIDVGHNHLAAKALCEEFSNKKIYLIFNMYSNKDYKLVLKTLKPIIIKVLIIEIPDEKKILSNHEIETACNEIGIKHRILSKISPINKYLIFGSFKVVEEFLKTYYKDK